MLKICDHPFSCVILSPAEWQSLLSWRKRVVLSICSRHFRYNYLPMLSDSIIFNLHFAGQDPGWFFGWVHSTLHDTSSIFGLDSGSSQGEAMSPVQQVVNQLLPISQLEIPRPLFVDSTRKPHPNPRPFRPFRRTSGSSGHIRFSKDSSVGDHQTNHARLVKKHTLANHEKPRPLCKCPMMVFTCIYPMCLPRLPIFMGQLRVYVCI